MLEVDGLGVDFGGGAPAVDGASLKLAEGDGMLVCGATGAGKSTLLAAAAGLVPRLVRPAAFSGSVRLDDRPLADRTTTELFADVGVVMQNLDDQLWDLGVEDLIAFPLENRGGERLAIRARVTELLLALGLDDLRGRRVLTLSGGERRMVALAASLAPVPRLLVLDEPTTGLDPAARLRLVETLARLREAIPMLLIAEQDAAPLLGVAGRMAFMRDAVLGDQMPTAAAVQGERPWLEAGVLPPRRPRHHRPAGRRGRALLGVDALRTARARGNGAPVLHDVSFEVGAGEVVGLIGRNGAGKTTLVQTVLGLLDAAAGAVVLGEDDAAGWTPARRARRIGYVPQNMRRVLFNLTVREELLFALTGSTRATADPALDERIQAVLERYGLGAASEASPFGLSTRQQALLGLGCVDCARADVAVLDEPLLARDLEGRRMLEGFLDRLTTAGRGAMLISHDLELIDDVTDRTLILDDGRIVFDGPTAEAWDSAAFAGLGWPAPRFAEAA